MTPPSPTPSPSVPASSPGAGGADAPRAFVDWGLARSTARRLTPSGPAVSRDDAARAVAELREAAARAHGPVAETARLHTPADLPPAMIVDRGTWADVNITSFSGLMDPVVARLVDRPGHAMPRPMRKAGGTISGVEVGTLLSFMATKVLGQYDIAPAVGLEDARLLLVAPNVVDAERTMGVDPTDFRLWVCLHEETHRVQFTANPWLREYMIGRSRHLLDELAPDLDTLRDRLGTLVRGASDAFKEGGPGLVGLVTTPEQRQHIDEVTALMSLLEGHADVVMDDVGPRIVPTVTEIRSLFEQRRDGLGPVDVLLRRLLGLEAKMRQYREGAAFVRGVVDRVGVDDFNAVWTSPETLPTAAEIADPQRWIARVHG
ncbi:zinc-dependent metalloprotease [Mobilicoccus pelagius]|uniref:Coenzyme F420 biosynthesis-associated protein n=1 Tax=Mobilicoccus pelagius NBRC 104925 TaxID=1089455 RepID=H5US81_9MICO|nr:zinc-dependent metalloprotease [Mobilicoccus pelagius]GAB48589.1 hypothetical protein MOPEL_074_00760 [Mobilicoccus pelagius NBRC 104925]